MRMIDLVHGHSTHGGSNVKPSTASSLTELAVLVMHVACHSDSRAGILAHSAHLTALKPHLNVFAGHNPGTIILRLFILVDHHSRSACTTAEDCSSACGRAYTEDCCSHRNHVHREAIAPEGGLCGEDTGIDNAAHAIQQVLGNASAVAVDNVTGPQTVSSNDVRLPAGSLLGEESNMCASTRIVLDALHQVRSWAAPFEIYCPYPSLGATTTMSDRDSSVDITTTLGMALLGEGQGQKWTAFPEMVVDRSPQMTDTRGTWLVGSDNRRARLGLLNDLDNRLVCDTVGSCRGFLAGYGRLATDGCVGSNGRLTEVE